MPTKFKDVAKSASDLLNNDFQLASQKVKIKSVAANGTVITSEGTLKNKGGTSGKVGVAFDVMGINIKKLEVNTDGRFTAEASLKATPALNTTVKVSEGGDAAPAADVSLEYANEQLAASLVCDVTDPAGPTLHGQASVGVAVPNSTARLVIGAETKYATGLDSSSTPSVADYNVGAALEHGDLVASFHTKKKLSQPTFSVHHRRSTTMSLAAQYAHASKLVTVGSTFQVDPLVKVQGKIDSNAIVSANVHHTVSSNLKVIASASVDAKNFAGDSHKFGLQLIFS